MVINDTRYDKKLLGNTLAWLGAGLGAEPRSMCAGGLQDSIEQHDRLCKQPLVASACMLLVHAAVMTALRSQGQHRVWVQYVAREDVLCLLVPALIQACFTICSVPKRSHSRTRTGLLITLHVCIERRLARARRLHVHHVESIFPLIMHRSRPVNEQLHSQCRTYSVFNVATGRER